MNQNSFSLYSEPMKTIAIYFLLFLAFQSSGQTTLRGKYNTSSKRFITSDTNYHIDFFRDGVARIYRMGYVGLMDSTGRILIEPQFDQIYDFEGDVAKVNVRKKTGLINKSGEVILEPFIGEIEAFKNGFAKCKIDYFDSRIVNENGKFINDFVYSFIGPMHEDRYPFIREGIMGLLTTKGEEIVVIENYKDEEFSYLVNYAHYGAAIILDRRELSPLFKFEEERALTFEKKDDGSIKFGCIDINGKVVVPIEFDEIGIFKNNVATARKGELWGVIDREGETVIPTKYTSISPTVNNDFIVENVDQFGLLAQDGSTMLKVKYPKLIALFDDLLITHNEKKWGVIDKSGKTILGFNHDGIVRVNDSLGMASFYHSSYSLNTGIPRFNYTGTSREFDKNGFTDKKGTTFTKTIEMVGDNYNPESVVNRSPSLYADFEIRGNLPTPEHQEDGYRVMEWLPGGYKVVRKDEDSTKTHSGAPTMQIPQLHLGGHANNKRYKYGLLDSEGKIIIPMVYDELRSGVRSSRSTYFGITQSAPTNLFIAKKEGEFGVIDIDHKVVIPFEYFEIDFLPGFIHLMRKGESDENDQQERDEWSYYNEPELIESSLVDFCGRTIIPFKETNTFINEITEEWYDDETRQPSMTKN